MGSEHGVDYGRGFLPPPLQHLGGSGDTSRAGELGSTFPCFAGFPTRSRQETSFRYPTPGSVTSTNSSTFVSPERDESAQASSVSSFEGDTFMPLEPRQNPRRTSASRSVTPPSFKRADDGHKNFIEGLLAVTTSFVEAIWPLSRETPRSSTDFNGAGVLPLRTFIQETCRRSRTSYSTLQIALYYLILLKGVLPDLDFTREQPKEADIPDVVPRDPHILLGQPTGPSGCRMMQCGRRMFMSALMLAAKYLQDRNFSVKAWAKISGLSCLEINKNEKAYLQSIEYRLHLKKEYFDNWSQIVLLLCNSEKKKLQLDYIKIIRHLTPETIQDPDDTMNFIKSIVAGEFQAVSLSNGCSQPSWKRNYHDTNYPGLQLTRTPSMHTNSINFKTSDLALAIGHSTHPDDQIPIASVYSCPPPRQGYTSISTAFREQTRSPPWSSSAQSTKSSSSSPDSGSDSIFSSDNAEIVPRSRSSSISSVSSFGSVQNFRLDAKATPHPSPLGRSCINAAKPSDACQSSLRCSILPSEQPSHLNVTPRRSEAVAGCPKRKTCSGSLSSDSAAATLVLLSKNRGEHGVISAAEDQMLPIRKAQRKRGSTKGLKAGHTSESVKAKRQLQRETSRMVKSGHGVPDAIPNDSLSFSNYDRVAEMEDTWSSSEETKVSIEDKENQAGHKEWAGSRKPVPVAANMHKRFAAADMAASMLRSEMKPEMCTVR